MNAYQVSFRTSAELENFLKLSLKVCNKFKLFNSLHWQYPIMAPYEMSHVSRKPVFMVCDQVRLKPACLADETS